MTKLDKTFGELGVYRLEARRTLDDTKAVRWVVQAFHGDGLFDFVVVKASSFSKALEALVDSLGKEA